MDTLWVVKEFKLLKYHQRYQKLFAGGWLFAGPVIKSTDYSSKWPGFNSQHSYEGVPTQIK